ncbi:uncharacterized protein PV06_10184 [Exophiala oligosperma]|uniref:Uncharacterized protein n=2 Tax=Chaetothyriales TaxID=34395 RepID=A0A0D2DP15_9EURO|nr:uncharacterized protein PV06_10184 [Exophiala oligosperma]KAJ9639832.1 hypothetical protein H2204_003625 [Knufia peltigerae]KIW37534.1 hypothetical protein PV06_10184 [Exophiala oligosperma]
MAEEQQNRFCFEVRIIGNNTNTTPPIIVPFCEARDRAELWNETVDVVAFWSDYRFLNAASNDWPNPPLILLQETSTSRHDIEHNRWKTINWDEASEYTKWFQANVAEGDAETLKIEIHFLTGSSEEYWNIYNQLTAVGKDNATMQDKSLVEIPFSADMSNLQNVQVVAGTNQWLPRREVDVLANANNCERCEAKAVELGLKRPSWRQKKAKEAKDEDEMETPVEGKDEDVMEEDTGVDEGEEGDVEMGDAGAGEGAGWSMDLTRRFR